MPRSASWSPTGFAPRGPDCRIGAIASCAQGSCCDMAVAEQRSSRETSMAVDGTWDITMSTPMGDRKATLTLKNDGGTLTGTQGADGQSGPIFDGTTSGD